MEYNVARWIEFGAILVGTGAVIVFLFFCLLGVRWYYRKKRMNLILHELRRDLSGDTLQKLRPCRLQS